MKIAMDLRSTSNPRVTAKAKVVWDSLTGTTHSTNEDRVIYHSDENYIILAVLDGVGSAKNNAIATSFASEFILKNHSHYYLDNSFSLREMIMDVNKCLVIHPMAKGTALTTCAICVYMPSVNKMVFVTLGDTRIYAVGKHYAKKLTDDDVTHPGSNIITKCLGLELNYSQIPEMVFDDFKDNILICSDGFYRLFEKMRLDFFDAMHRKTRQAIKSNLHDLVVDKNSDDASYIFFKNV